MYRRYASSRLYPSVLILSVALFSLFLAGCNGSDAVDPVADPPSAGAAPVLAAEPAFSPGNENIVSWSFADDGKKGSTDWEFLVQRSGDPLFAEEVEESGWITSWSFEFTGLEHGSTHNYRVRGRNPQGAETEWSASQASTQDAVPPVAALTELEADQTSLLFNFGLSATDETSGIQEIELWFGMDGGETSLYGTFPPGEITFQATQGGTHEFFPVAIDGAGNRQDQGQAPAGVTQVPEPVIITDIWGEEYDITNAVYKHGMAVTYWDHGIGRYTISPIIDPMMIGPGEAGYPLDNSLVEILALNFEDDNRAYKIRDLTREVVDDVVNGIPVAVCY